MLFSANAFSEIKKGTYECDNERNLNVGFNQKLYQYNVWFSHKGGFAGGYSAVPFIFKLNPSSQLINFSMEKTGLRVGKIALSKYDKNIVEDDMIILYFEENLESVNKASFNNPVNPRAVVTCIYSNRMSEFYY